MTSDYTIWWRSLNIPFRGIFRVLFSWRTQRLERIPSSGAALIAGNHMSFLDPLFLCLCVTKRRRGIRFLTAAEFFPKKVVGWALRTMQQIPIRRGEGDTGALDAARDALHAGALVGIFPEGKINDAPATLLPGRTGLARLAVETSTPIVPVGIWGPQHRLPRGGLTWAPPIRTRVTLVFGEPIVPDPADATEDGLRALTDRVMREIDRLRLLAKADCERRNARASWWRLPR